MSGEGSLSRLKLVDADYGLLAALDGRDAPRLAFDQALLHVAVLGRGNGAAEFEHAREFGARFFAQRGDARLNHFGAVKQIRILEQIGFVREHLLNAQRPLLVPRARQAERFIPRRQLQRAAARTFGKRDAERFEHDADDVVFGLRLGEPERIHLHAVAKAQLFVVGDAVPFTPELFPQCFHRARLAHFFDEANAGVQKKRNASEDAGQGGGGNVIARAHRVEHGDGVGEGVGNFLHRRRACFLQVVTTNVDRVPLRNVVERPRNHVANQPHGRRGREHVGAARKIFLDDVVLRRARKRRE